MVGGGFHLFFVPRTAVRLHYSPTRWLTIAPGATFRPAIPIMYDETELGWSLNELNSFGFDLAILTAPKWLKQAKAGQNEF